jgi:hypothetical protein
VYRGHGPGEIINKPPYPASSIILLSKKIDLCLNLTGSVSWARFCPSSLEADKLKRETPTHAATKPHNDRFGPPCSSHISSYTSCSARSSPWRHPSAQSLPVHSRGNTMQYGFFLITFPQLRRSHLLTVHLQFRHKLRRVFPLVGAGGGLGGSTGSSIFIALWVGVVSSGWR